MFLVKSVAGGDDGLELETFWNEGIYQTLDIQIPIEDRCLGAAQTSPEARLLGVLLTPTHQIFG